ncbi:mediator of RNA polymerase II transcription subunit 15-like [Dendronephthya gigantea]|uniref:mediator of RNA polymerase II transcription subunit 15-like n=1 Tax=Dendronephthya gigantea TaxID=151771 RepID=UPI00106CF482|nr:mediator of RNA polymerase II transcription subunit 15-like [Dendronephthya gigantea]XP_028415355.1 mediator of RNA polymerase II transcription subunit 15-like [Dendronephthya gigantea]XP_028415356.1 mediator of RNA polymerase II transcription subunit 15-like [Dendronephthya gigantea]XP_028415358.1 mediator of RNA polymerase II transcription subunit 15-like [Dendronephthya gigantea]
MSPLSLLLIVYQLLIIVWGKHLPLKNDNKRKAYPRQMIIPNKFIPMLKQSALFKARSSSNDLSNFLKRKSHNEVTGKTRQNLMSAMGMDSGPSQEEGGMGIGGMGPGGMGQGGMGSMGAMGAMGGGMPNMAAMGGSEGMGSDNGGGGLEDAAKMAGMGGQGGISDQMSALNNMGGIPNSQGGSNPLAGLMGGNNEMNPMNNGGSEGMMSDSNQPPAGDPMGTLKSMLDTQGTNAALGTNAEAFGPGGSANTNVLAMLNQIVGKEMPGDSPVDPSSKQQQMWDQLQNKFSNAREAVQPYLDTSDSKSSAGPQQADAPPTPPTNNNPPPASSSSRPETPSLNQTTPTPVYNLTGLARAKSSSNENVQSVSPPESGGVENSPSHTTATPDASVTSSHAKTSNANVKSKASSHENSVTKATSNPSEIELDDDQPLSDDMVKFLKGVKFVVSQEPGNDIILGKKFTSDVSPASSSLKEENGVMKNLVSENNILKKGKNSISVEKGNREKAAAVVRDLKGVDLSYARNVLLRRHVTNNDIVKYQKAARVLQSASKKLKDPIAKKSTEIAISSILKVLDLENKKKTTSSPKDDPLTGGDVKTALSEKYFEAARVLGTASKKLADPVAKKSAEIGIASILKVIALGNYSVSKKDFVPLHYHKNYIGKMYFNPGPNRKRNLVAAGEVARELTTVSRRKPTSVIKH